MQMWEYWCFMHVALSTQVIVCLCLISSHSLSLEILEARFNKTHNNLYVNSDAQFQATKNMFLLFFLPFQYAFLSSFLAFMMFQGSSGFGFIPLPLVLAHRLTYQGEIQVQKRVILCVTVVCVYKIDYHIHPLHLNPSLSQYYTFTVAHSMPRQRANSANICKINSLCHDRC